MSATASVITLPTPTHIPPQRRHRGRLPKDVVSLNAERDRRTQRRTEAVDLYNKLLDVVESAIQEVVSEKISSMRMRP